MVARIRGDGASTVGRERAGKGKTVFFVFNLLQDVNIVRGLVYLTARETGAAIAFLVSEAFLKRDGRRIWQGVIAAMAADVGATLYLFADSRQAQAVLGDGSGIIFAASESTLPAHGETAEVFRVAPAGYLRITLQHGLECVGFAQSREHSIRHGRNVGFNADIICSWFEEGKLTSLAASQRSKVYVSGPPTQLQARKRPPDHPPTAGGLVCENLHSVRLGVSGENRTSFAQTFLSFCERMSERHEPVTLRPHPGGQYLLKNRLELPDNVVINNLPSFDVDLPAYAYGVSPPSSVILDMVLARIPVAVWRDPAGTMDLSNYAGLAVVSTLDEWLQFERDARVRREDFLERQDAFLNSLGMPTQPADVYRRLARLIVAGLEGTPPPCERASETAADHIAKVEAWLSNARPERLVRRATLSENRLVDVGW